MTVCHDTVHSEPGSTVISVQVCMQHVSLVIISDSPAMAILDQYQELAMLKANNQIPVAKYKSLRTGLAVTVAQVEGPVVNGYFCLATEAHDDDGLPHTLEHLIFLGSEKFPYKGVLDLLANRCLSSGRNWKFNVTCVKVDHHVKEINLTIV